MSVLTTTERDNAKYFTFPLIRGGKKGPQIALHAVTSTNDPVLAGGTNLRVQLVITIPTDEVAGGTLHNPGVLGHVLHANRAFRVRDWRPLDRCFTGNLSTFLHETVH